MSAILEALKKLEADADKAIDPGVLHESSCGSSLAARHFQARPAFLILAGLVLLFVFGMVVWHTAVMVTGDKKAGVSEKGAMEPGLNKRLKSPAKHDKPFKEDTGNTEARVIRPHEALSEKAETVEYSPTVQKPLQVKKPAPDNPDPESGNESAPEAEIMTEGPLTLQAVSWSKSREERFAVINGRICREGAMIQNYRILLIKAEEVSVTDGTRTWRLVFRLR